MNICPWLESDYINAFSYFSLRKINIGKSTKSQNTYQKPCFRGKKHYFLVTFEDITIICKEQKLQLKKAT